VTGGARSGAPERRGSSWGASPSRGATPSRAASPSRGGSRTSGSRTDTVRSADQFRRGTASESRIAEPPIPGDADIALLDRGTRAELRTLSKPNAEAVAGHLVAAGLALESDPALALSQARAARARASRIAAVREAVGIAAYHAQEWPEALTELRTARRISGDPRNLPLMADCERALGRPNQALRLIDDPGVARLDPETRVEMLIVIAGARRDLGQVDAALAILARGGLDQDRPKPGASRLWYAYADALEAAGRIQEAANWFGASAARDVDGDTDAVDRAAALL